MKRFPTLLFPICLFAACIQMAPMNTDGFVIKTDTLRLHLKDYIKPAARTSLTHAVKYDGRYYCIFQERGLYYFSGSDKKFFVIAQDGTIVRNPALPGKIAASVYLDLFIRNDSILTKAYMDEDATFYFDPAKAIWSRIDDADDVIYEDKDYTVMYLDFGEWGTTTWFRDRHTQQEYELRSAGNIVNKTDSAYYITSPYRIFEIRDPEKLKACTPDNYYDIVKHQNRRFGSESRIGTAVVYGDSTANYGYWTKEFPATSIITSFTNNGRLYHICVDSLSTYIAMLENGVMKQEEKIGPPLSPFNWHYSYRYKILKDNSQLIKFSSGNTNTCGFLEIRGNKIDVRYLIHDVDSLCHTGTDGFPAILNAVCPNIGKMALSSVDSLEHAAGGVDMRLDRKGGLHESYYPNGKGYEIEGAKEFIHVQDSMIANTAAYFYTKNDSLVKVVFLEWTPTVPYNRRGHNFYHERQRKGPFFRSKLQEIEQTLTDRFGKKPVVCRRPNKQDEKTWISEDNNVIVNLYHGDQMDCQQIRMVIYEKE